jgi:hypothetical protein
MQEIKNVSIFKCDFCGKKSFRKCDTTAHEKWCSKNPANNHACFRDCRHLLKTEEEYFVDSDEPYAGKRTVFTCAVNSQKMFSYLAERRKHPVVNEPDAIRMPLECDKHEYPTAESFWEELNSGK